MQLHPQADVFGIPVQAVSMAAFLDMTEDWIAAGVRRFICTLDVHALMESQADDEIRRIYRSAAAVVTPDGMPIVWFLRRHGFPAAQRICGPDLMPALFGRSGARSYRHFLYGGSANTLTRLRERLAREFPRAQIVGAYSPPFRALSAAEDALVVDIVNEACPDVVWVGLGAPKQERWMATHFERLRAPVLIGVGAAFDMLAGTVRRAPIIFQRTGCEWMFRIAQEPRRLGKRYLTSNSQFAIRLLGEILQPPNPPSRA